LEEAEGGVSKGRTKGKMRGRERERCASENERCQKKENVRGVEWEWREGSSRTGDGGDTHARAQATDRNTSEGECESESRVLGARASGLPSRNAGCLLCVCGCVCRRLSGPSLFALSLFFYFLFSHSLLQFFLFLGCEACFRGGEAR
jgi:hypothetical protein